MKRTMISFICCAAIVISVVMQITHASNKSDVKSVSDEIISIEKAALARYNNGDPSGYLEIYADDITYFDEHTAARLDGYGALKKLYDPLTGQVSSARFEMLNPLVQRRGDAAVLTFNLKTYSDKGEVISHWNSTEVYFRIDGEWKIIHSHWSLTKEKKNN